MTIVVMQFARHDQAQAAAKAAREFLDPTARKRGRILILDVKASPAGLEAWARECGLAISTSYDVTTPPISNGGLSVDGNNGAQGPERADR